MVSLDVLTVSQGRFFLPGIFGVCHPAENLTRIKWDDRYDRGRRRLSPACRSLSRIFTLGTIVVRPFGCVPLAGCLFIAVL